VYARKRVSVKVVAKSENMDLRFRVPFRALICGPSESGKTFLTHRILKNRNALFVHPPQQVLFFYNQWQDIYDRMSADKSVSEFVKGNPSDEHLETLSQHSDTPGGSLVIIDDGVLHLDRATAELFTVFSHHRKISCIFISQMLFSRQPFYRTLTLNVGYIWLCKNPRDSEVVTHFARQFMPGRSTFVRLAYEDATRLPFGYLLIDLTQQTPTALRLRTNVIPDGDSTTPPFPIVYHPI
jgi:hypothetical protein